MEGWRCLSFEKMMKKDKGTLQTMNDKAQNQLQTRLFNWLMRKTNNSSVRRVGELPLAIGTDIGVVRGENQDRVAILRMQINNNHSFTVAVLCDGMGGMAEGSACAAQAVACFLTACIRNRQISPAERVVLAAQEANRAVHSFYQGRGGATLSAMLLDSIGGIVGVNVGDSRIYAYQENKLEQITIDDTMAGHLKDDFHSRNELLQFVGMGNGLEPHVIEIPASHEMIILTSDGVHFIDKKIMQMVIQAAKESALAVRRFIEIAKWCGGRDNASAIAIAPFSNQLSSLNDPGVIQIWDPFGELQIILSEAVGIAGIDNKPPWDRKPVVQEESQKSKQSAKRAKKEKPAKRKVVAENADEKPEKDHPQLNIYFNGDPGKDSHD